MTSPAQPEPRQEPTGTGLPLLRTWGMLYSAVAAIFGVYVLLLWLLTETFS